MTSAPVVSIVAGLVTGLLGGALALHAVGASRFAPTPPAAASNCRFGSSASPYAILEARRPDVLTYYAAQGWQPLSQCRQIYDDWLAHAPDGGPPLPAAQYVQRHDWSGALESTAARGR